MIQSQKIFTNDEEGKFDDNILQALKYHYGLTMMHECLVMNMIQQIKWILLNYEHEKKTAKDRIPNIYCIPKI